MGIRLPRHEEFIPYTNNISDLLLYEIKTTTSTAYGMHAKFIIAKQVHSFLTSIVQQQSLWQQSNPEWLEKFKKEM